MHLQDMPLNMFLDLLRDTGRDDEFTRRVPEEKKTSQVCCLSEFLIVALPLYCIAKQSIGTNNGGKGLNGVIRASK